MNCAIFFLLACPAVWMFDREIRTVKASLGIGREARIRDWLREADKTGDARVKWKYCQEILAHDPKNGAALSLKSRIANEKVREARDLMSGGRTQDAILTLVLAIRVDPRTGYYWVWLDNWVKAWVEENRTPRPQTRSSPSKHK